MEIYKFENLKNIKDKYDYKLTNEHYHIIQQLCIYYQFIKRGKKYTSIELILFNQRNSLKI